MRTGSVEARVALATRTLLSEIGAWRLKETVGERLVELALTVHSAHENVNRAEL